MASNLILSHPGGVGTMAGELGGGGGEVGWKSGLVVSYACWWSMKMLKSWESNCGGGFNNRRIGLGFFFFFFNQSFQ
jgi:hypothetical protein